ncbi:MAG: helix-turn-helix domain-containing protein [Spirochaetota bacterium]
MSDERSPYGEESWNGDDVKELLEYQNNPFDTDARRASDIMRIFYQDNLSLVPVVSRQNVLLGVITKERLTAAMSDIENFELVKIDRFITSIAEKLTFEELLPMVRDTKEFAVINIFGQRTGSWSRIDLLEASDTTRLHRREEEREINEHKEEQKLEWMIYMILEHIPRALYAVNTAGKTLFYNGFFEEKICERMGWDDMEIETLENTFADADLNDFVRIPGETEHFFYNSRLDLYYEKQPMKNNGQDVGYLIYCPRHLPDGGSIRSTGAPLAAQLEETERMIIVDTLRQTDGDEAEAARILGLTRATLTKKKKKMEIVRKTR